MPKSLRDYAHFYKGCQVKVKNVRWDFTGKLVGTTHDRILVEHPTKGTIEVVFKHCKLILKQIDDITEEDALLLLNTSGEVTTMKQLKRWGYTGAVDYINKLDESYTSILSLDIGDSGSWHKLLGMGYDLFALIESNLAIDAAKVKA
jgi:hypothetical protein